MNGIVRIVINPQVIKGNESLNYKNLMTKKYLQENEMFTFKKETEKHNTLTVKYDTYIYIFIYNLK
jgi:hypothetical protein